MLEKVHRIQDAGLEVWCGMIMGFDNDDSTIFDAQIDFVQEAQIPHSMSGMLHAIAKTPLHARLAQEGRLDPSDTPEFGTNVIPLKLGREELQEGYVRVMNEIYDPEQYFSRLEDLWIKRQFTFGKSRTEYNRRHPLARLKAEALALVQAIGSVPPDARGDRGAPPPRVPAPAVAVPQAPPRPGDRLLVPAQDGAPLPRLHDGDADEVGAVAGVQLLVNSGLQIGAEERRSSGRCVLCLADECFDDLRFCASGASSA